VRTVLKLLKRMVNNLGIDPDEWFNEPEELDLAPSEYEPPVDNRWAPPERRAELEAESNPRPEEEVADWFGDKKPEPKKEEEKTIHEKMYEIATSKYNPFSVGGSESLGGGSEKINGTE